MNLKEKIIQAQKLGFRPSFVLDQYFIIDEGVLDRAVNYADLTRDDTVLEIGPGLGFLTERLAKKAGQVIAVEKDKKLEKILRQFVPSLNVQYVFEDFLEADVGAFNKVVSNIPFSASAPITFKLLDHDFEKAVLFYQKEFGEKMLAKPGDLEYGRLSVMVQYYYEPKVKEVVPRYAFQPQPKTDAIIMELVKKPIPRDEGFDTFVRELFRYKNKDVGNAFNIAFGRELKDDRKVRMLSINDLEELFKKL